jgi:hypothetical protein
MCDVLLSYANRSLRWSRSYSTLWNALQCLSALEFSTDQSEQDVCWAVLLQVRKPIVFQISEWLWIVSIEAEYSSISISVVYRRQTSESFLSSGIPNVQLHWLEVLIFIDLYLFFVPFSTNSRLDLLIVTSIDIFPYYRAFPYFRIP